MNLNIKKVGKAVAGSALLVGATLTGAAGLAAAQDSGSNSMDLGDYPTPFVSEDGQVQSTIVVGENAKTADVVGAINVAGSLGQAAMTEEEVSAGSSAASWSATNGVSLDTSNDQLFFNDNIDEVRQTLTEDQLDILQSHDVLTGDAQQEVEQYLYVGEQKVQYTQPGDSDGDPVLNVMNPSSVDVDGQNLYRLQANFEDGVEFEETAGEKNEDVYGEEMDLFGKTFTISQDSFTSGNTGQLILYGSSQDVQISSGESATVTIDGEDHTIAVQAVNTEGVVYSVDGEAAEQDDLDETFDIGDTEVRIDSKIDLQDDQGSATFSVGSEKLVLEDDSPVMTGDDEEDVEGTHVGLSTTGDGDISDTNEPVELSSIEIAVGADDSDNDYVAAGESFEDPVFDDLEFHFAGLNPDAESDDTPQVEFTADDETATVSFEDGDDSASLGFVHPANTDSDGFGANSLADEDGDAIHVYEGAAVEEDEYFVSDAGDFDHMWEVTGIDADTADQNSDHGEEATVDLEDKVSGASVEVDVTHTSSNSNNVYSGTEVIDGQTYEFTVSGADTENTTVSATYGDDTTHHVYSAVDTESGASVAFLKSQTDAVSSNSGDFSSNDQTETIVLPSTESSGTQELDITFSDDNDAVSVAIGDNAAESISSSSDSTSEREVTVGSMTYDVTLTVDSAPADDEVDYSVDIDPQVTGGEDIAGPSAAVIQPQDDDDNEGSYLVTPGVDSDDDEMDIGSSNAEVHYDGEDYNGKTLDETDEDVESNYNTYGTYTELDTDEQGMFTLNIPDAQATAGAAFTGQDGELSASGSAGSVTTMSPTGWPDAAALDSEVSGSDRNGNLILVGGPAVNTLTEELASANKTWTADQYSEGDYVLDLTDGFQNDDGNHALVVAGYGAEDTTAAANYLANYQDNMDEMDGETTLQKSTVSTSQ
ncbi:MAG: S-layer protein [Nanohaloarchaea archaeon]|nr:S-layer protein [Candidatus Nanohaloarchaea archaeon]